MSNAQLAREERLLGYADVTSQYTPSNLSSRVSALDSIHLPSALKRTLGGLPSRHLEPRCQVDGRIDA